MSELLQIQPYVQRVAAAIAAALKVEVEIVDNELIRVGGTGKLLNDVGTKQKRGFVNKFVLNSGQPFTITNPGEHRLCSVCELNGKCFYNAGIFAPINLNGDSIGIISIISFNKKQREVLLRNQKSYLNFLLKMTDLMGAKVSQYRMMKKLEVTSKNLDTIINTLKEGVIAVDDAGKITFCNKSAQNLLGLKSSEVIENSIFDILPQSPLTEVLKTNKKINNQEVIYTSNDSEKAITVLSSCYPIRVEDEFVGALESFTPLEEVHKLAYKLTNHSHNNVSFDDIIGSSKAITEIKDKALKIAASSSTILIEGESGTGKELFAQAIHNESPRSNKPFIAINCSAIPESLLESELFGYEEGAFTGAKHGGKAGKFELANGGTIFLDEIGEMPLYLQSKLLRVLQERTIERIGGIKDLRIDVRVIAATNRDLGEMVSSGEFRADLFYRLNVIPLKIPPLRERNGDIKELLDFFLKKYNNLFSKKFKGFTPEAKKILEEYRWPGNVRELENAIEYACNLENDHYISVDSLPQKLQQVNMLQKEDSLKNKLENGIKEVEKNVFIEAFKLYGTSSEAKNKIASVLGMSRATLYRRLGKLGEGFKNEIESLK